MSVYVLWMVEGERSNGDNGKRQRETPEEIGKRGRRSKERSGIAKRVIKTISYY